MFFIKDGVVINDFKKLKPNLMYIFSMVLKYCDERKMQVTITSIFSDRENVNRVSSTHETFRAIDLRTRDWTEDQIMELERYLNSAFLSFGAITKSGNRRVALYHNRHLHIQVEK